MNADNFARARVDRMFASLVRDPGAIDAFWSVSLYNAAGYFEANDRNAFTVNNVTVARNDDDTTTIHFGGCGDERANCLPIFAPIGVNVCPDQVSVRRSDGWLSGDASGPQIRCGGHQTSCAPAADALGDVRLRTSTAATTPARCLNASPRTR